MKYRCDECGIERRVRHTEIYKGRLLCYNCLRKHRHIISSGALKYNELLSKKITINLSPSQCGEMIEKVKKDKLKKSSYIRSLILKDLEEG